MRSDSSPLLQEQMCCFVPIGAGERRKLSNRVGLTDIDRHTGRQALAASLSSAVCAYQSADGCTSRNGSDKFKYHVFRTFFYPLEGGEVGEGEAQIQRP